MRRLYNGHLFDAGEALAHTTSAGRIQQWIVGFGLAALLGVYAIVCLVRGRAAFVETDPLGLIELEGPEAIAVGIGYLSVAVFMHCHWFWTAHPDYHGYAQLGKLASLFGIIGGFGYWCYHALMVT